MPDSDAVDPRRRAGQPRSDRERVSFEVAHPWLLAVLLSTPISILITLGVALGGARRASLLVGGVLLWLVFVLFIGTGAAIGRRREFQSRAVGRRVRPVQRAARAARDGLFVALVIMALQWIGGSPFTIALAVSGAAGLFIFLVRRRRPRPGG